MQKLITTKEYKFFLDIETRRLVLESDSPSYHLIYWNYNICEKPITYIETTDFCSGKSTLERKLNAVTIKKVQISGSGSTIADAVDALINKSDYFKKYYGDKRNEIIEGMQNNKQMINTPYDMSENENTLIIENTLDYYHESITGVVNPMCYTGDVEITEKKEELEKLSPSIKIAALITK